MKLVRIPRLQKRRTCHPWRRTLWLDNASRVLCTASWCVHLVQWLVGWFVACVDVCLVSRGLCNSGAIHVSVCVCAPWFALQIHVQGVLVLECVLSMLFLCFLLLFVVLFVCVFRGGTTILLRAHPHTHTEPMLLLACRETCWCAQ